MLEGKAVIRGTSAGWKNGLTMKFRTDKCKVFSLGRKTPLQGYRLGVPGWGAALRAKPWGALMGCELNMSLQWL